MSFFKGLEALDTIAASEEGAWLTLRNPFTNEPIIVDKEPLRLKLAGPDSERFHKMLQETAHRMERARGLAPDRTLGRDQSNQIMAECFAPMVLDWEGFRGENGQPVPCSREQVERLFRQRPRLRQQADQFVGAIANFAPPTSPP
jgi:hypothetical protein